MAQIYKYCYFNFVQQVFCEVGGKESEAIPRGGGPIICIWSIVYFFVKDMLLLLLFVERSNLIFCGTIHFYILWNIIINLPMFSGTVEEPALDANGNTLLRNSTDGNIRKNIDSVNETQDKDKPFNTSCSWRPRVAEYKAMCFSIKRTERVPELMTMEKAYNFLFLQAHRPTWPAGRKKKEEVLNPKGKNRDACKFLFCGTIIPQKIKMDCSTKYRNGSFHKI
jgi:hypothetical protein